MPDGQGQAATFALGSAERIEVLRGPFSSALRQRRGRRDRRRDRGRPPSADRRRRRCWPAATTPGARRASSAAAGPAERARRRLALRDRRLPRAQRGAARPLQRQVQVSRFGRTRRSRWSATSLRQPRDAGSARPDARAGRRRTRARRRRRRSPSTRARPSTRSSSAPRSTHRLGAELEDRGHGLRRPALGRAVPRDPARRRRRRPRTPAAWCSSTAATAAARCAVLDRARRPCGFRSAPSTTAWTSAARASSTTTASPARCKRDEDDEVSSTDFYAQAEWQLRRALERCTAGVRTSRVEFKSSDYFIVAGQSRTTAAARDYSATTPVAGLLFRLPRTSQLYGNVGRGFETPTFAELAHQNPPATGLNFALEACAQPARRGRRRRPSCRDAGARERRAVRHRDARRDRGRRRTTGGRTTFKNAGRTERSGFELAARDRCRRARSARSSPTPTSMRRSRKASSEHGAGQYR